MISYSVFGLVGGTLTNLSLVPQILKAIQTKSVNDISIAMFWALFAGVVCWCVYGILLQNWVLILMNALSLLLNAIMIYLYYHYRHKKESA